MGRYQVANKKSEVSALQLKWWESKEKQQQKSKQVRELRSRGPGRVEAWKEELRDLLHGRSLWEAWQKMSADPEKHIAGWARQGAPLGMSVDQGDGRTSGTSA